VGKSKPLTSGARFFILAVAFAGLAGVYLTFRTTSSEFSLRFFLYLLLAMAGAVMKISLPEGKGSFSANHVVIMIGLLELGVPETLMLAIAAAATQTLWSNKGGVKAAHVLFNTASNTLTVMAAAWVFHRPWFLNLSEGELLRLTLAGTAYCIANMSLVATIVALA
jgi:hypothetical protein